MEEDKFITFPPPLLGKCVEKLKVLYSDNTLLALDKPSGMLIDAYPWYQDINSIVAALRQGHLQGCPELAEYLFNSIYSVYSLEPEITGVALIATDKEMSNYLRNELGSGKFIFKFALLAKSNLKEGPVECSLPLAKHYNENTVLVSNKTGKKCKTVFNLLEASGSYQLWEAQTDYIRMHQIRVHAMERGIHIIGEDLYTETLPQSKTTLGRKLVLCDSLCLHLSSVEWQQQDKKILIESPLPTRMTDILEKHFKAHK